MRPKYTTWVLFPNERVAKDFCAALTAQDRAWCRRYRRDQAPDSWEVRWNET